MSEFELLGIEDGVNRKRKQQKKDTVTSCSSGGGDTEDDSEQFILNLVEALQPRDQETIAATRLRVLTCLSLFSCESCAVYPAICNLRPFRISSRQLRGATSTERSVSSAGT